MDSSGSDTEGAEEDEREEMEKELLAKREAVLKEGQALFPAHPVLSAYSPSPAFFPHGPHFHPFLSQQVALSLSQLQSTTSSAPKQEWKDEEQPFKSLYELSDDPNRKDFLDELFSFMQKRGTPINRLPIMAKQVLDLYELYNLVVARGGLVEVIYKKLWQEIIKGLKLPSSITSAAFTLRTQYMKYLYAFECEKEQLSTTDELQAAIDGNRREGRRMQTYPTTFLDPQRGYLGPGINVPRVSPLNLIPPRGPQTDAECLQPPPQKEALNLSEAASKDAYRKSSSGAVAAAAVATPRTVHDEEVRSPTAAVPAMLPTANIRINNRGEGRTDGSLLVSMEVNGVIYQGVLFAHSQLMGAGNH